MHVIPEISKQSNATTQSMRVSRPKIDSVKGCRVSNATILPAGGSSFTLSISQITTVVKHERCITHCLIYDSHREATINDYQRKSNVTDNTLEMKFHFWRGNDETVLEAGFEQYFLIDFYAYPL